MIYDLYDHVDLNGVNTFKVWALSLQTKERAKLNQKIDMLEMHGTTLYPQVLTGTEIPGIQKLRIKGNVQLRPLLCIGPVNIATEFTFLEGAVEVGGKLKPANVLGVAQSKKQEVILNPEKQRTRHERVS